MDKGLVELARDIRPSRVLPHAVSLGLFFVWFETAFPLGVDMTSALAYDPGWLSALAAAAVASAVLALLLHGADAGGESETHLCRACAVGGGAGAALMAVGSACFLAGPAGVLPDAVGGVLAGAGMVLLVCTWLPAGAVNDGRATLLVVTVSVAVSIVATFGLSALKAPAVKVALCAAPVVAQACAVLAMRADLAGETAVLLGAGGVPGGAGGGAAAPAGAARAGTSEADAGVGRRVFPSSQGVVVVVAIAAAYFLLPVVGTRLEPDRIESTYALMNAVGVVNLALLALMLRRYDAARIRVVMVLLLATATAAMPLSLLMGNDVLCFSLVKLATFFAFVITLLHVASGVRQGRGSRRSRRAAMLFMASLCAVTVVASLAGEWVSRSVADDAVGASLVAVQMLYILLVAFVLVSSHGRDKVLHVITGSFNDESQIARVRVDVICQQYPDLSSRERDVLFLLIQNYSTPRIAGRLSISENTAKTHLRHIYAKLGVRSRQQVMEMAEQVELHPDDATGR